MIRFVFSLCLLCVFLNLPALSMEEGKEEPSRVGGIQITLENADLCTRLLKQLGGLSQQERMVFVLRELQDLDTAEVARAMGISTITVRRHGAAARQKLKKALEGILVKKC